MWLDYFSNFGLYMWSTTNYLISTHLPRTRAEDEGADDDLKTRELTTT